MAPPPHAPDRLPLGLCVFGMTYACGMTWSGTERAHPEPLTAEQVIELAARCGLSWVEVPASMIADRSDTGLRALRAHGERHGIRFVVPSGLVTRGGLSDDLRFAAALGAPTIRCTLSSVLCGDRRAVEGGWQAYLERCARALDEPVGEAERLGIALACENHQDATSEELLWLCRRFESPALGVTLDTGNPLAVMEEPLAFARRVGAYLKHVHVKDYRVHPAPNGYRLVRCALGDGVIDFPALFGLLDELPQPITRSIEMGALQARLIPILEPTWWDTYPRRDARELLPALSLLWNHRRPPDEEWRTPFERDASGAELLDFERAQYRASLEYVRRVVASPPGAPTPARAPEE